MKIIAFAFRGNISSKVLEKLDIDKKYYLKSDKKELEKFVEELIKINPKYILGLGMYSGRDKDKLRIETHYSENGKKFPINYFLTPGKNTKLASGIGNSYCNYISALIMKAINGGKLNSKYTFIHVPKSFEIESAVEEIGKMMMGSF